MLPTSSLTVGGPLGVKNPVRVRGEIEVLLGGSDYLKKIIVFKKLSHRKDIFLKTAMRRTMLIGKQSVAP